MGRLIEFSMRICFMGEQLFFILESNPHGFPYMALKYSALLHDFSFAGEGTFCRIIICFWLLRSYQLQFTSDFSKFGILSLLQDMICAIAELESDRQPLTMRYDRKNKDTTIGIMQLSPITAEWLFRYQLHVLILCQA